MNVNTPLFTFGLMVYRVFLRIHTCALSLIRMNQHQSSVQAEPHRHT